MKHLKSFVLILLVTFMISSSKGENSTSNQKQTQASIESTEVYAPGQEDQLNPITQNDSTKETENKKEIKELDTRKITRKINLEDENDEEQNTSILSFNFIHYILQKFKFSDILGTGH